MLEQRLSLLVALKAHAGLFLVFRHNVQEVGEVGLVKLVVVLLVLDGLVVVLIGHILNHGNSGVQRGMGVFVVSIQVLLSDVSENLLETVKCQLLGGESLLVGGDLGLDLVSLENLLSKVGKVLSPSDEAGEGRADVVVFVTRVGEGIGHSLEVGFVSSDVLQRQSGGVDVSELELQLIVVLQVELDIDVVGEGSISEETDEGLKTSDESDRGVILEDLVSFVVNLRGDG